MKINEIFKSIQGEGTTLGIPTVFVRTTGCNLNCNFCDTNYSKKEGFKCTPEQLVKKVYEFKPDNITLTGGEPLMQQEELADFISLLIRKNEKTLFVEVETNGTILPMPYFHNLVNQYNVSLKLSNSGSSYESRTNEDAIKFFVYQEKAIFKFVVDKEEDFYEINELEIKYGIPKRRIIIMPQGYSKEELEEKTKEVVKWCIKRNYRMTPRLHVMLYGNKRKV